MTTSATQASDEAAIAKVVQTYIDGGISGSGEAMRPACHKVASIFG